MPQVARVTTLSGGLRNSFVSVDVGSTPHELLIGEYADGTASTDTRVVKFPLAAGAPDYLWTLTEYPGYRSVVGVPQSQWT
jgi:hypothetical protein